MVCASMNILYRTSLKDYAALMEHENLLLKCKFNLLPLMRPLWCTVSYTEVWYLQEPLLELTNTSDTDLDIPTNFD